MAVNTLEVACTPLVESLQSIDFDWVVELELVVYLGSSSSAVALC